MSILLMSISGFACGLVLPLLLRGRKITPRQQLIAAQLLFGIVLVNACSLILRKADGANSFLTWTCVIAITVAFVVASYYFSAIRTARATRPVH